MKCFVHSPSQSNVSLSPRRATPRLLLATLFMAMSATAMAAPQLVYVPSTEAGVDHDAIVQAFTEQGFQVRTFANEGENRLTWARRVAGEVRGLMTQGVAPQEITVVGAGTGSGTAALASAVVGNARVNYVLLGQCDPILNAHYRFRMSGRVLGIRDDADSASHSCRQIWTESPRVSERRDMALNSGHGSAFFHEPRQEWLQPLVAWSGGGTDARVGWVGK